MELNDENIEWLMQTSQTVDQLVGVPTVADSASQQHLKTFLKLLETEFISKSVLTETEAYGVLKSEENFQSLLRKLKAFGYFFAVRTSRSSRGMNTKILHNGPKEFQNRHPYSVNKCVRLYCSVSQPAKTTGEATGRCPGMMMMRHVAVYNTFSLCCSSRKQSLINQTIRKRIASGVIQPEEQLWVSISLPHVHNHKQTAKTDTDKLEARRGLDLEVRATMLKLSSERNLTIQEVKSELKNIVEKEFSKEGYKPSPDNRAFYPSDKVIYNHLRDNGLVNPGKRKTTSSHSLRNEIIEKLTHLQGLIAKNHNKSSLKKILNLLTEIEKMADNS